MNWRVLLRKLRRWLRSRGLNVERVWTVDYWAEPESARLLAQMDGRTLLDPDRLQVLAVLLNLTRQAEGDLAEAGVYQGGSARLIRNVADTFGGQQRELFLLDTFGGMPAITRPGLDLHSAGDFGDASLIQVQQYLSDLDRITFLPGLFSERFSDIAERKFSFAHVDCDLYESTRQCTAFFGDRLSPGGVMAFDDYGFKSCPGAKQAVDEWAEDTGRLVAWLPTGQAFTIAQ